VDAYRLLALLFAIPVAAAQSGLAPEVLLLSKVEHRVASDLEELTLTLGEGPCLDAFTGGPALVIVGWTQPASTNSEPNANSLRGIRLF